MNYTIYIQSLNNFPVADWAVSAYMGFKEKQANIVFFEDIEEVPVSKASVVVAFIEDTNKYLEKMGLPAKRAMNIPDELNQHCFLHRSIYEIDYEKLDGIHPSEFPLFIKPAGRAKEFVAGVVKNKELADVYFKDLKPDTRMMCSQVVDFVSEYRCYIINGELKGIKHYLGDPFKVPDKQAVMKMLKAYTKAPAGYSLDVGVLFTGETVLVECNDGWSLGNYGLDNSIYSTLLATRWREMMKDVPVKDIMNKGLFDPERLRAVNEMRKTWKYIPYNQGTFKIIGHEDKEEVPLHKGEEGKFYAGAVEPSNG